MKNYLRMFVFMFCSASAFAEPECSQDTGTCSAYPLALASDFGNWSITPLLHFATPSLKALAKVLEVSNRMPAASRAAQAAAMFRLMSTIYRNTGRNHSYENSTLGCELFSDVTQAWANYYLFRDLEMDRARSSLLRFSSTTSSEFKKQKSIETPFSMFSWEGVDYMRRVGLTVAELAYVPAAYFKSNLGLNCVGVYKAANHMYEVGKEVALQQSFRLTQKMVRGVVLASIYALQMHYRADRLLFALLMATEYISDALLTYESK